MLPREHPLAQRSSVPPPEELLQYPFIIETPGCDNDILHLLEKYPHKPLTVYSFRDATLIEYLQANLCRDGARADALKACAPLSDPDKNPRTDAIKQSTV